VADVGDSRAVQTELNALGRKKCRTGTDAGRAVSLGNGWREYWCLRAFAPRRSRGGPKHAATKGKTVVVSASRFAPVRDDYSDRRQAQPGSGGNRFGGCRIKTAWGPIAGQFAAAVALGGRVINRPSTLFTCRRGHPGIGPAKASRLRIDQRHTSMRSIIGQLPRGGIGAVIAFSRWLLPRSMHPLHGLPHRLPTCRSGTALNPPRQKPGARKCVCHSILLLELSNYRFIRFLADLMRKTGVYGFRLNRR